MAQAPKWTPWQREPSAAVIRHKSGTRLVFHWLVDSHFETFSCCGIRESSGILLDGPWAPHSLKLPSRLGLGEGAAEHGLRFAISMLAAGTGEFLANPPVVIKNYQPAA